jgi:hypothetical protein
MITVLEVVLSTSLFRLSFEREGQGMVWKFLAVIIHFK